ncbi:MAG TPA: polysaccharide biosynthesis C-terminal domain-containing protein [Chloroflexia bacterium]|nr:polysaccharide biosynthesis C-terminal domain-containing protein [Chloroflexia bacterium]
MQPETDIVPETKHTDSRSRFLGSMLWNQLGRVGEVGLSLLFTVLVVRTLSSLTFGAYSTIINFLNIAGILTSLGLSDGLYRYVPLARATQAQAPLWLFRRFLLLRLLISLIATTIIGVGRVWLALWFNQPAFETTIWLILLLFLLYNLLDLVVSFFSSMLWVSNIVLIRLGGQLLNIILLVTLFLFNAPSLPLLLLSLCISNLLMLFTALGLLARAGLFQKLLAGRSGFQKQLKQVLSYSRDLWLINFATIGLMGQIDIIVLALLAKDPLAVAHYSLASLLIGRLYLLAIAWSGSLGSIISTVFIEKKRAGLERYFVYYYRFSLPVHLIPMVALAALSPALVSFVFGESYRAVAGLLAIFTIQQVFAAMLGSSICASFINTLGRQKLDLRWRTCCSLLNIGLDILLAPLWGATGVVIATVTANILLCAIEAWLVRELFAKLGLAYTLKVVTGVLSGGLLAWLIRGESLAGLALEGSLFASYLLLFFWLVKPLSQADKQMVMNIKPGLAKIIRFF